MFSSLTGLFGKNTPKANSEEKGNVSVRSPDDIKDLEKLISVGPVTLVLVHADWCGPCQMYKPIWKELENVPGRTANMAMVHHDMVEHSSMLNKAKIPGYPTVLKVYPDGAVEKYSGNTNAMPNIRDKVNMTKELTTPGTAFAASLNTRRNMNNTRVAVHNTLQPGQGLTVGATNAPKLGVLPMAMKGGRRAMRGGSLFAALSQALVQAGPSVLLLGATQLLPPKKGTGSSMRLTRKSARGSSRSRSSRSGRSRRTRNRR